MSPYSDLRELCTACPNRHISRNVCVLDTTCKAGETYRSISSNYACRSCSDATTYEIGTEKKEHDLCKACGNRSVVERTSYSVKYYDCVKTTCDSTEFMGKDGKCYSCTNQKSIEVSTDSGCESNTCGRSERIINEKTYCQPLTCKVDDGSHVRISDGSCYDCTQTSAFVATEDECNTCTPKRQMIKNADGRSLCMLESLCIKGESYPFHGGNYCQKCSLNGGAIGPATDFSRTYCEACDSHVVSHYCFSNNKCVKGFEFQSISFMGYNNCITCDSTQKFNIGTHMVEQNYCSGCSTTKRFWAGEYCYRCDTNETPNVDTLNDAEMMSCTSCPQREVIEGKCVLKQ